MDSLREFYKNNHMDINKLTRPPRALEPLHGLYMSYLLKEDGIHEGNRVNILATNLNRDVFLWENAEVVKIEEPEIYFIPDNTIYPDCPENIINILLDKVILIQNVDLKEGK